MEKKQSTPNTALGLALPQRTTKFKLNEVWKELVIRVPVLSGAVENIVGDVLLVVLMLCEI